MMIVASIQKSSMPNDEISFRSFEFECNAENIIKLNFFRGFFRAL